MTIIREILENFQIKKVYIILATYNGEKYISEQIDSLLSQAYDNWKLWIHDDFSSDNTVTIIRKYIQKYPNKIILLDDNIRCGGAKENFTHLINSIDDNFDYLMFCDQDDVWLENKIEITLKKMLNIEEDRPALVHTNLKVVDDNLKIISKSMFDYQKLNPEWSKSLDISMVQNSVTGCTIMINKLAKEIISPIPSEAIMHDWWILLKILEKKGNINFIITPTILYRQHSLNSIGAGEPSFFIFFKKIFKFKDTIKMAQYIKPKKYIFILIYIKIYISFYRLFKNNKICSRANYEN